jgi:hypothetical protein
VPGHDGRHRFQGVGRELHVGVGDEEHVGPTVRHSNRYLPTPPAAADDLHLDGE